MSYDDSRCPCGGKKPPGTMLCDECVTHFADRRELRDYQDPERRLDFRQHAATILVALARGRRAKRQRDVWESPARQPNVIIDAEGDAQ